MEYSTCPLLVSVISIFIQILFYAVWLYWLYTHLAVTDYGMVSCGITKRFPISLHRPLLRATNACKSLKPACTIPCVVCRRSLFSTISQDLRFSPKSKKKLPLMPHLHQNSIVQWAQSAKVLSLNNSSFYHLSY